MPKLSRYLKPLMAKTEGLLGYSLNPELPLPAETPLSYPQHFPNMHFGAQRLSLADSVSMLRTLSMSGNLGMPSLTVPLEDWTQRRPSGRILDDSDVAMEPWMLDNGAP